MIPVIDLFAGPGGLGEGFSSITDNNHRRQFKGVLSIECNEFAHQTLTLRSFLRQFEVSRLPKEYYQFIRQEISQKALYNQFPQQFLYAANESWKFKVGNPESHNLIDRRIIHALKKNKDFVLIGGPPCQAYSLVGRARRKEGLGLSKEDERVYLYREYYRILAVHRPPVFVMENVKGLISSKVENEFIFDQLINDLKDPIEAYKKLKGQEKIYRSRISYNIYSLVMNCTNPEFEFSNPVHVNAKDFIIRAEDYGVPQTRHRVILLGIRSDISKNPAVLKPSIKSIPIEDVINGLPRLRSGLSKTKDGKSEWQKAVRDLLDSNLKDEIEPAIFARIKETIQKLEAPVHDLGNNFIEADVSIKYNPKWFLDKNLHGVCNHSSRSHIKEDLHRYLFASCFSNVKGRSPKLADFPQSLLPKHINVKDAITHNKFADRFRTQIYGCPSKTITSHISKDGHYFIHPDPTQCRSLTVREAARIQTFPDNYFFCGPRTEQFHQVGNAVPPILATQIAEVVKNILK